MATLTTRPRRRAAQPAAPQPSSEADAPKKPGAGSGGNAAFIELERRRAMISDAAYFLAERRSFCPGRELDDWLAAEREIDRTLTSGEPASYCG